MNHIGMSKCGIISVVGEAHVIGYLTDGNVPIFLNMWAASGTPTDAVWARLAQGKEVTMSKETARTYNRYGQNQSVYMAPGAPSMYEKEVVRIKGLNITNMILVNRKVIDPDHGLKPGERSKTAYLIAPLIYKDGDWVKDQTIMLGKFNDILRGFTNTPLFPEWCAWLVLAGRKAKLVNELSGQGIQGYSVVREAARWDEIIQRGVRDGYLQFPSQEGGQ